MGLGESTIVNRAKSTLAKAARRGERFGGTAEKGVRETMGRLGIGRSSAFASKFAEENDEKEEKRESSSGSGNDWRKNMRRERMMMGL